MIENGVKGNLSAVGIAVLAGVDQLHLCFAKNPSAVTSVGGRTQSSKYVGSRLAFVFVINLGLFDFSF
jgi:hypothetical protein